MSHIVGALHYIYCPQQQLTKSIAVGCLDCTTGEIKNVENLHLWRLRKASSATLQLTHDGMLDVCIGLGERGMVSSIETSMARASEAGSVSAFAYQALRKRLNADAPKEVSKVRRVEVILLRSFQRAVQELTQSLILRWPAYRLYGRSRPCGRLHATSKQRWTT